MSTGQAHIGLIGKHPGYGDFLRAGLSLPVADALSDWLDRTLSELRDSTGNDWPAFWAGAQSLRFWAGRAVLGRTLAGVMRPSQDRVGRRYPLVLVAEGAHLPPPVQDTGQDIYESLEHHLDRAQPGQGAKALLEGLDLTLPEEDPQTAATGPTIWAHHPEGDLNALLGSAAKADPHHALLIRSYWWAPGRGDRAAVWLGCTGLPNAQALGWLLAGVAADAGGQDAS